MKKLLILVFLILAVFSLPTLEREDYMPSKLIYNELPDDFPAEVEELLIFLHNSNIEMQKRINMLKEKNAKNKISVLKEMVNKLTIEEVRRYTYLDWIGRRYTGAYYREYINLNGSFFFGKMPYEKVAFLGIPEEFYHYSNTELNYYAWKWNIMSEIRIRFCKEVNDLQFIQLSNELGIFRGKIIEITDIPEIPKINGQNIILLRLLSDEEEIFEVYWIPMTEEEKNLKIGSDIIMKVYTSSSSYFSPESAEEATINPFSLFCTRWIYEIKDGIVSGVATSHIEDEYIPGCDDHSYYDVFSIPFSVKAEEIIKKFKMKEASILGE